MMKAPCLAAAVLLLCGLANAQIKSNYQVMPAVSTFPEAVQGCSNIGGKLAGENNEEQSLVLSVSRDMNMEFWVNAEPSLRVFGRCKVANKEGSLVARLCNAPSPIAYICIVEGGGSSTARTLSPSDRLHEVIASRFDAWNDALQAGGARNFQNANNGDQTFGNGEEIVKLYTEDATLLATLTDEIRTGRDAIRNYFDASGSRGQAAGTFTSFLAKNPVGKILERVIQSVGPDTAVDQGTYAFQIDDGQGGRTVAYVRFTYVYKRVETDDGMQWLIKVHHSSQSPQYQSEDGLVKDHLQRWFNALYSGTCGPTETVVSTVTETDENGHEKTTVTKAPIVPNCVDDIETRAQAVASLYAPDGVLLATVSPIIRVGRNNIVDYMRYFLNLDPEGSVVDDRQDQIKYLTATSATYVGNYKFRINSARNEGGRTFSQAQLEADPVVVRDVDGNPCTSDTCDSDILARFSYTYTRNGAGQWLISEHHSSALPVGDVRNGQEIEEPLRGHELRHLEPAEF